MALSQQEFSDQKSVKCVCPLCSKTHKIRMFWTGNGTPKKYCRQCTNKQVIRTLCEDHNG